jgi:hypothetical protein
MAPAKVESGGEWTPPTPSDPTEQEKAFLQIRRRLGMREAAKLSDSCAVGQLLDMKDTHSRAVGQLLDMKARAIRATKKNLATLRYLEWLTSDHPLPTAEPLIKGRAQYPQN